MNKVILIGRVVKKVKFSNEIGIIRIAVKNNYNNQKDTFISVKYYEQNSYFIEHYLNIGDLISLEAFIDVYRNKENKEVIGITLNKINILAHSKKNNNNLTKNYNDIEIIDNNNGNFDDNLDNNINNTNNIDDIDL